MKRNGSNAMRWSFAGDVVAPAGQVAIEVLCLHAILICTPVVAPGFLHLCPDIAHLAGLAIGVAWLGRLTLLLPWPHRWTRAALIPLTGALALTWLHLVLVPAASWQPGSCVIVLTAPKHLDPGLARPDIFTAWALMLILWIRGLRIGLYPLNAGQLSRWLLGGLAVFLVLAGLARRSRQAE